MEYNIQPEIAALLILNVILFIGLIQESRKRKRDIKKAQREIIEIINKKDEKNI